MSFSIIPNTWNGIFGFEWHIFPRYSYCLNIFQVLVVDAKLHKISVDGFVKWNVHISNSLEQRKYEKLYVL